MKIIIREGWKSWIVERIRIKRKLTWVANIECIDHVYDDSSLFVLSELFYHEYLPVQRVVMVSLNVGEISP